MTEISRRAALRLGTEASPLLNRGRPTAARQVLEHDFVDAVDRLRGRQLTDAEADELVASAALISSTIQHSTPQA